MDEAGGGGGAVRDDDGNASTGLNCQVLIGGSRKAVWSATATALHSPPPAAVTSPTDGTGAQPTGMVAWLPSRGRAEPPSRRPSRAWQY